MVVSGTKDNIEHIESTTYNGQSVIKIFLQPGASLDTANKDTEMSAVISDRANPVNFDTRLKSAVRSRNVS